MMNFRQWFRSGSPWIWLNAAAVTVLVLLVGGLLLLLAARGLGHFWPAPVDRFVIDEGNGTTSVLMGQVREREEVGPVPVGSGEEAGGFERILLKTGNRDLSGQDFQWLTTASIKSTGRPLRAVVIERAEWGVFIGFLLGLQEDGQISPSP